MTGPLALVGGGEWSEGCTFDRLLIDAVDAREVVVLPTMNVKLAVPRASGPSFNRNVAAIACPFVALTVKLNSRDTDVRS